MRADYTNTSTFDNRVALVTGAAGNIGFATCDVRTSCEFYQTCALIGMCGGHKF